MSGAAPGTEYYDRPEIWSEAGSYGARAEIERADLVTDLVVAQSPGRVLDVGAGSGLIANRLHERGVDVLAYDFSAVALEGVTGPSQVGDLAAMPFGARSFDVVVASEVLEHLGPGTFERACAEMQRVAGRSIVVTVPNREDLVVAAFVCPQCRCRSSPHRHVRSFDEAALAAAMSGFDAVDIFEFGPGDVRQRRWEAVLRRDLLQRWDWPASAICPLCGFSAPQAGVPAAPRASSRRSLLARPFRYRRKRWLGAVFSRR